MKNKLPEGIPTTSLSDAEEMALARKIQKYHHEDDINKLAMHSLHEALPYLSTVSGHRIHADELLSVCYEGLVHAASNFKPNKWRFFNYAKIYLRNRLNKWWKSQDVVRNSSKHEDKTKPINFSDGGAAEPRGSVEPLYDALDLKEKWELVKPLLSRLTERERIVLELVYLGGFSYSKIAGMLVPPVSREAVRISHLRAMRRMHFAIAELKRTSIL